MSRHRHPMTSLVVWLGVTVLTLLLVLVWVVSQRDVSEVQLNHAHLAGMELGQTMCLGFRSEIERGRALPAATHPNRSGEGLL